MDQREAIEVVQRALDDHGVMGDYRLVLFGPVVETDRAWIFRFQSSRWLETRKDEDLVIGAGPLYVDKRAGEVYFLGTYAPADVVIRKLERLLDEQKKQAGP